MNALHGRMGLISIGMILKLAATSAADVPRMIHYQGMLRESSGALVNGAINLRFRLYGHESAATPILFEETHPSVNVANGLFNVLIGSRTAGGAPDSALNAAAVYLGISINGAAELSPRPQIVSNPHAIKARSSERLVKPGSFDPAAVVDGAGNVGVGTQTPGAKLDIVGDGATVLVPRKSGSGDPTEGVDGMIYYNTATGKFRGHENGSWGDMRDGSGSASDPCNCPRHPWELIGVINSTRAFSGVADGAVDVSDNQREYLYMYATSASEFTVDTGADVVIYLSGNLDTSAGTYKTAILDNAGALHTGALTSSTHQTLITAGAVWSQSAVPVLMFSIGYAYVYSNGTVRLYDGDSGSDMVLWVLARAP